MTDRELRRLVNAATPGPWSIGWADGSGETSIVARDHEDALGLRATVVFGGSPEGDISYGVTSPSDAAFIAAARTEVPRLLADKAALEAENERLRAASRAVWPSYIEVRSSACHAGSDGDCEWPECPQLRDGEPGATGRHCPLDFRPNPRLAAEQSQEPGR